MLRLGLVLRQRLSTGRRWFVDNGKKSLDVAIVGAPNAGKSQLLNVLTDANVAAVSRKRHTTKQGVLGVRTMDNKTQLVFWDTPGYQRGSVRTTNTNNSVDYTLLVVDAAARKRDQEGLVTLMVHALEGANSSEKFGIVLNKVDLVHPKSNLLEVADELGTMAEACIQECLNPELLTDLFPPVFYVSALHKDGTDDVLHHLLQLAIPCDEWAIPASMVTNLSPLERIEEIIREKLYRCLHREVPHQITQVNRLLRESNETTMHIHQDLVVKTKSHQRLVLGSGQRTLKRIQETAQRDLKHVFPQHNVLLRLHVKLSKSQHERPLDAETASLGHIDL